MGRYDRYMLSQLLGFFGAFALVLILIYWINRAAILLDTIISDGQSFATFLELTALFLPSLMRIVLPMAAFAATLYATNRLIGDSELTVLQATGVSPWRLSRPVLWFGLVVALLMSLLTHVLVPAAAGRLNERRAEIAQDTASALLRPGRFVTPTEGLTVFIRDVTDEGEMRDIFLSDRTQASQDVIYTAARAYFVRGEGAAPQLVMLDGMVQTHDRETGRLGVTTFADLVYDLDMLAGGTGTRDRSWREVGTLELMRASPALREETGQDAGLLVAEAHERITDAVLAAAGALLGFATLMVGGFSRFGVWKQVVAAIGVIVVVKMIEAGVTGPVRADARLWPMIYVPSAAGFLASAAMLRRASGDRRRPREVAA